MLNFREKEELMGICPWRPLTSKQSTWRVRERNEIQPVLLSACNYTHEKWGREQQLCKLISQAVEKGVESWDWLRSERKKSLKRAMMKASGRDSAGRCTKTDESSCFAFYMFLIQIWIHRAWFSSFCVSLYVTMHSVWIVLSSWCFLVTFNLISLLCGYVCVFVCICACLCVFCSQWTSGQWGVSWERW